MLVPCSLFVNYEIEFKSSAEVASADALSRLPLHYRKDASVEEEIFHVAPQQLKRNPVSAESESSVSYAEWLAY